MGAVVRGALATVNGSSLGAVVSFQYNPEKIERTLTPQFNTGQDQKAKVLQYSDAPSQSITFTAFLDASDKLQTSDSVTMQRGIAPQLAQLESFAYPSRSEWLACLKKRNVGEMEIQLPLAGSLILVWGDKRVYPVRITSLRISETMFDAALNPIQANAVIAVNVLTYNQSLPDSGDYLRFFAYHGALERDAQLAPASPDKSSIGSLVQTASQSLDAQANS